MTEIPTDENIVLPRKVYLAIMALMEECNSLESVIKCIEDGDGFDALGFLENMLDARQRVYAVTKEDVERLVSEVERLVSESEQAINQVREDLDKLTKSVNTQEEPRD